MLGSENSKKKKSSKSFLNKDKQSKNNFKEKLKKIIKVKREKENKIKEKYEYNSFNGKKNKQLEDSFDIDIVKKENFLVNKYSKLQKTLEKNSGSGINKNWLKKKSIYHFFKQKL